MMGRLVELRRKSPDEWAEITAWCTEQFGPPAKLSPRGVQGGKWLGSYYAFVRWGDVYFRHEEDAAFFMLRWS